MYCSDALPPASLASIPCLYVLYWIYVEGENFQHKKNVESAISYNTFWLELMKDFSEQPDKTCYIVFIIHMLFQKLLSQCSESVIDLLIPIECSPSASVNKIFVGTIIYIHCSLRLPSPYVINCRVPALFIWQDLPPYLVRSHLSHHTKKISTTDEATCGFVRSNY